jgi:ribosomal protein S18 acetylase RimI-like enzyme
MHLTLPDSRVLPVRPLVAADAAALQRFNAELGGESRHRFLPHAYDDQTVGRMLARSEAGDDFALGAFDGDRLAGYFFLWHYRSRVPLLGIGLLDEYQGRGLGRQMMTLLLAAARRAGCEGIELTTMFGNERAFSLYQKMGFRYLRDVETVQGDGSIEIERAMFCAIKPGASPMDGSHRPPV